MSKISTKFNTELVGEKRKWLRTWSWESEAEKRESENGEKRWCENGYREGEEEWNDMRRVRRVWDWERNLKFSHFSLLQCVCQVSNTSTPSTFRAIILLPRNWIWGNFRDFLEIRRRWIGRSLGYWLVVIRDSQRTIFSFSNGCKSQSKKVIL